MERMTLSASLGDLLASEEFCGLTYDQIAIGAFVDKRVPADDMQFASFLDMQTEGRRYSLKDMSASSKAAHCRQVERVAKSYGFVK